MKSKPIEDEFRQAPPPPLPWSFVPETMAGLLAMPEPKLEWLIQDLWVDKSRGFIAGHPGVGKTWIALDMLLAVSSGQLCLTKYKPAIAGPCLLVEEEASLLNLKRRVHALARARHLKDAELTNLHHITRQFIKIPQHEKELIAFIKAKQIKFAVFDSLRRLHNAKENSSDEMQPILESFARINVQTEASILLIHHLAKSNDLATHKSIFERMRGSSDLWAWRDCLIGVEGEEDADVCKCSFQFRDAEAPPFIQVKRHVNESTGAIALEAVSVVESEEFQAKCQAAIAFVTTQMGEAFLTDIAKSLEGRKADNLKAVKLMLKQGIFEANGNGKLRVPV